MRTKLIWISAAVLLGVFFINNHSEEKSKREIQQAERKRIQQETKSAVAQMSQRYHAVSDWSNQLSKGENYRQAPILTIELEHLWQGDRPILFIGPIKDVSTLDSDNYELVVERGSFDSDFMFSTEFRLSLRVSKALLDSFLKKHPKLMGDVFDSGVAVVGKISSITTDERGKNDENGEIFEVKTGKGELLEIQYVENVWQLIPN